MKKHIANIITGLRIVLSLPLLFIPLTSAWFYALYLLCGLSDMIDGTVARRTSSASEFGARLDTVSDFVFMTVALIKFVPHLHIPIWLWIWIGVIAMIKFGNMVWGFSRTKKLIFPHTVMNKIAGLLLFLLPVTISFVDLTYTLPIVCTVATVAAMHEVYLHTRRKNMILETNRLIIREYTPGDFDALYEILSDAETMKYYPKPYDENGVHRWINWCMDSYRQYGFGLWALELKETGAFITERWHGFKALLEAQGYVLADEHEHTFARDGVEYSYADIEDLESFAGINTEDIELHETDGVRFLLLSLEQYLAVYKQSSKDGYRVNVRQKKDADKIRFIRSKL